MDAYSSWRPADQQRRVTGLRSVAEVQERVRRADDGCTGVVMVDEERCAVGTAGKDARGAGFKTGRDEIGSVWTAMLRVMTGDRLAMCAYE